MRFITKVTILTPPDVTQAQLNKNSIGGYSLFVNGLSVISAVFIFQPSSSSNNE
jgi:hypothetical protein